MKVTVHDVCPKCRQAPWDGGEGKTIAMVLDLAQIDEDLKRTNDDEFNSAVFFQLYQIRNVTNCDCWSKVRRLLPRHMGGG
jgi:hypothetical protein